MSIFSKSKHVYLTHFLYEWSTPISQMLSLPKFPTLRYMNLSKSLVGSNASSNRPRLLAILYVITQFPLLCLTWPQICHRPHSGRRKILKYYLPFLNIHQILCHVTWRLCVVNHVARLVALIMRHYRGWESTILGICRFIDNALCIADHQSRKENNLVTVLLV